MPGVASGDAAAAAAVAAVAAVAVTAVVVVVAVLLQLLLRCLQYIDTVKVLTYSIFLNKEDLVRPSPLPIDR